MKQPSLFEGEEVTRRFWEMTSESRNTAADITLLLLRESAGRPVTFHDIVKRRCGIVGDSIPEHLAELYADQFKMIRDGRHFLKEAIEDTGEFLLVIVNVTGAPAERGGKPYAFMLRATTAGVAAEQAQLDMSIGKIRAHVNRGRSLGYLSQSDEDHCLQLTADIESALSGAKADGPAQ